MRKNGTFWAASCVSGKAIHPHLSLSLMRKIVCWGDLPRHWVIPPWERDDMGKVKLLLLNSSMHLFSDFFASTVLWTHGLPQRYSHLWVMDKINVTTRNDSRELLFCHLPVITPLKQIVKISNLERTVSSTIGLGKIMSTCEIMKWPLPYIIYKN